MATKTEKLPHVTQLKPVPQGGSEEQLGLRRVLQSQTKQQAEDPAKFIWLNGWLNWSAISPRVVVNKIPSCNPFSKVGMKKVVAST